jgi:hypothetical protein
MGMRESRRWNVYQTKFGKKNLCEVNMKGKILLVILLTLCAVMVAIPLQAALADAPPEVKAVFTIVTSSFGGTVSFKDGVVQALPDGTIQTVDCPQDGKNGVTITGAVTAKKGKGKDAPLEIKCIQLKPGEVPTLPDGTTFQTVPMADLKEVPCPANATWSVTTGAPITDAKLDTKGEPSLHVMTVEQGADDAAPVVKCEESVPEKK